MATNDIGRVTPIWRGFYSAATTYELNDIVIDTAGSVWWHKSEELTTGVIPEAGEIWDAVLDMSVFSRLIQAAITTAQTALAAAQAAVAEITADTERAETAAQNAEISALNAAESASDVGAQAQAAAASAEAAAGSATGAANSASAAAGSKSDAEAYAVGMRSGEDVESTDPTYHNNAKYYAEQAASEAEAAAQSAEDAQDVLDSIPEDYSQLSADVGDLKTQITDDVKLIYNVFNPNADGEIAFPLAWGYWTIGSDALVWTPSSNKKFISSAYPVKVNAGDKIHIINDINTRYFALYSSDGSSWDSLVNTTTHDTVISNDGYVLISVRLDPNTDSFTDKDVETFFAERLIIVKNEYTNLSSRRMDNVDLMTGMLINDTGYTQVFVSASESTMNAAISYKAEVPAIKGDILRIKADLTAELQPECFASVELSVRERYNDTSIGVTNYNNLSDVIEYTVTHANTTSIAFVFVLTKASASSVDQGYYENILYNLAVTKKIETIDVVLTESGESWTI